MARVALVTGSSRGLGSVIARRLAHDGFDVVVNGLPGDEDVSKVAAAIGATAFHADITDPAQVARFAGPVDVLVFNATGPQPNADVLDVGWQEHLDQLDFFVRSPVLLGRLLVPGMIERGYGRIVHIDSEVADRPPVDRSAYVTAKSAQIGLALSWARELAPHGITVNTVAPGFVPVERHSGLPPEVVTRYLATVPAGRMGTPDDIAHAVSFLAGEGSGFITGQRLVVDGGRSLGHSF
ncbi:SDR family oxidoreductase [Kibdelosporangium philippinense]|uniref:SDR family oxidoreductase n=1 Tax=Kibdelosporangium philippinense TaxID=211113 RepID=A0ABS8ZG90_9PSEU|nr:SDR family oxidoreductase [Kibdelosporangium philippinense]MCE7006457.1 SDR family oxidoreductase [Kibdelosporangium philippinense]